ncbi:hypothetical protein ACFE04_000368 [Oxalis oulophora]
MDIEDELKTALKLWLSVLVCLSYCFGVGKVVPAGSKRLVFVLPVVGFFLYLPLNFFTVIFGGVTGFIIAWLANFKLLLFAFGKGPLTSHNSSSVPLAMFLAVGCFPIKIKPAKLEKVDTNDTNFTKYVIYSIKGVVLATLVYTRDYQRYFHPKIRLFLLCLHIYLPLETGMAVLGVLARVTVGLELEPPFNEPYLSTSLQDFWGKRWNLVATSILRPTVYKPTVEAANSVLGREWAPVPAVLATFFVSAFMHEIIYYYLSRMPPKGDFMWFFLLHGVCMAVELGFKKALGDRWRLPWMISGPLTIGFVMATSSWLFFPPLDKIELFTRLFEEYNAYGVLVKNIYR